MLIPSDVRDLGINTFSILENVISSVTSVDWSQKEFDRGEPSLKDGRLCLLPYLISKPEQLIPSINKNKILNAIQPLIELVQSNILGYKIIRGEVANLMPGVSLIPHVDIYWFHKVSRRIHIPITTNLNCELTFEGRPYHLEVEKVYEINNRIVHAGYNNGNTDRVHLILDMIPFDAFDTAIQTKQNFMEVV
jgi:hypothetical protein